MLIRIRVVSVVSVLRSVRPRGRTARVRTAVRTTVPGCRTAASPRGMRLRRGPLGPEDELSVSRLKAGSPGWLRRPFSPTSRVGGPPAAGLPPRAEAARRRAPPYWPPGVPVRGEPPRTIGHRTAKWYVTYQVGRTSPVPGARGCSRPREGGADHSDCHAAEEEEVRAGPGAEQEVALGAAGREQHDGDQPAAGGRDGPGPGAGRRAAAEEQPRPPRPARAAARPGTRRPGPAPRPRRSPRRAGRARQAAMRRGSGAARGSCRGPADTGRGLFVAP